MYISGMPQFYSQYCQFLIYYNCNLTFLLKDTNVRQQWGVFNTFWPFVIEWNLSEDAVNYEGCSNETSSCVQYGRDVRPAVTVDQQQPTKFFGEESISWCVSAMAASMPMRPPFNDLMPHNKFRGFHLNNPRNRWMR
jgi:hypothetical protein